MSKFSDKFLNMMRLNDGYDEEYDEYDEYDEFEEEEVKPARGFKRNKIQEDDYEDDFYDVPEKRTKESVKSTKGRSSSKVVPMKLGRGNLEVCVIKPIGMEDSREIADTLLSGRAVVLNLEGLHVEVAQRISDFTSGACYAIHGNLQKISNYIFIITPESVEISGDFQDKLSSGGFDIASFD